MSDIQLYLFEVDKNKPEAQRIAAGSAEKLESKQLKLIDLIGSLEEYINNKDDGALRAKTVGYLADVLEKVPPKVLSLQERKLLADFILGRLEGDLEGVGASARALMALEQRGQWDSDTAQTVMNTFLAHSHPLRQFALQTERFPVIQLIDLLLAKYRTPMKQLHDDDAGFMPAFISYFEGEKDPRNLMIVFSLLQVPMAEWDIQANAQDMFEAVFNYFPITFKPPPDDPYGITAQDLKDRLRDCIAANSDFAAYAFPALLDKLDSTSLNTKRDVLHTIQACVHGYSINTVNLYSVTLWDALKFEVINLQEEDLAQEALDALASIGKKLAGVDGLLTTYLKPVIKECNEHLEDAPTRQSQAAGRILLTISKASPMVADKVARGVLPVLFSLYNASSSIAKRRGLLEVYNDLTRAHLESQNSGSSADAEALQAFASEAVGAMLHALAKAPKAEVSFRLVALKGLTQLVSLRKVLSDEQIGLAVGALDDILLHERIDGHGDISCDTIKALVQIAGAVPETIRSQTVPAFMVELPDVAENREGYRPALEAFAQLSQEQQVFDTIVLRIKNKLKMASSQNATKEYIRDLLLAILYCFTNGSPLREEDGMVRSSYFTEYAEPLIAQLRDQQPSDRDDSTCEIIGRITNIILRQQKPHFQSTVYNQNLEWLSSAATEDITTKHDRVRALAPFCLQYYAAIRPEIVEPNDIVSSLGAQASWLLDPKPDFVGRTIITRLLSLFINKFLEPKLMEASLQHAGIEVEGLLAQGNAEPKINVAFSVIKALLVQGRCGALTTKYLQLLLQQLPAADRNFARKFSTLLAPDEILSKENHCVVSGLYKQRTFNQVIPALIEAVRSAAAAVKPNYLIAMSGILQWVPYTILESSLAALLPSLLQTLDLPDPAADQAVKSSTLAIFESLLMHQPALAVEHTASLITRLLNSTVAPDCRPSVRSRALQCLALLPKQLKREAVIPYRRPVVKKLLNSLDDPKRGVRFEAVRCRSAWLALDEGDEGEEEE
jgi:DNA repair/transcription protein MET18/MMS19